MLLHSTLTEKDKVEL